MLSDQDLIIFVIKMWNYRGSVFSDYNSITYPKVSLISCYRTKKGLHEIFMKLESNLLQGLLTAYMQPLGKAARLHSSSLYRAPVHSSLLQWKALSLLLGFRKLFIFSILLWTRKLKWMDGHIFANFHAKIDEQI